MSGLFLFVPMKSPYFSVLSETDDFVCIQLNGKAVFNGTQINQTPPEGMPLLYQHLLDEHGLVQVSKSESFLHPYKFIFHKIGNRNVELVDRLSRQGII